MGLPLQERDDLKNKTDILVLASIFENDFSIDWLLEMSREKASAILTVLDQEQKKGHLQQSRGGSYCFCDPEFKAGLYRSLSPETKEQLRRQASEILLRELPERSEHDRRLPGHLLELTNDLEGCRQLAAAGNRCRKAFRFNEAHTYYQKAIRDLGTIQGDEADRLLIETTIHYLKISNPADLKQIRSNVADAIRRAEALGLNTQLAILRMSLAIKEWTRSRYPSALREYKLGWALAREIEDPAFRREANVYRVFFQYWQGMLQDVVSDYEKYAPEIEEIPQSKFSFIAQMAVATCLAHMGHFSQGLGMMNVIRKHCLEIGNINIGCNATCVMGLIFSEMGQYQEAIRYFEEALDGAIQGHNQWVHVWALHGLAYACYKTGSRKKSVAALKNYLKLSREFQYLLRPFPLIMELCWEMEQGRYPRVEGLKLEEEIAFSIKTNNIFIKGVAFYYRALLKKNRKLPDWDVHKSLKQSLACLERSGRCIYLAHSRLELARLMLKRGQRSEAAALALPEVSYLKNLNEKLVPDDFRFILRDLNNETELLKEILKLGQELVTFRDHRDLAGHIISTVNRLIGAERGAIFIIDKQSGKLVLRAAKNLTSSQVTASDFSGSMQIITETARTGRGTILAENHGNGMETRAGDGICSLICVPMILRNRLIGVLYHDNRIYTSSFQESDQEMLGFFAAQAAIALDNAEAYQKLKNQVQKEKEGKRYFEKQYLEESNFEEIVGRSREIKTVFTHIESVADTDTAVLILGETGVGKELVARAIHQHSQRRSGPFIRVNCSAFSETLISSELFGHEKGAFTGATDQRLGRFELADGGTLFLDEVGDIPLGVQVKLLRVLQNNRFERVGGQRTIRSNFRLMAATNMDLEKEVQKGRFRMDLYYRLNVFPIRVPPLRERKDDIPLLAFHFLNIYAKKLNRKIGTIPADEIEKIVNYAWPGNVRELENFIERGVILSDRSGFHSPMIQNTLIKQPDDGMAMSHQENERNHIVRVLQACHWKVAGRNGAASHLDLHPNTLRYRMKKLGIHIQRQVAPN
ncbi:sigma 54-interacting transcriptional regulator [bacterium]|nr:sigma 54-interacting transcriptional regulator [bacterium]